jgi:hypothetical protein
MCVMRRVSGLTIALGLLLWTSLPSLAQQPLEQNASPDGPTDPLPPPPFVAPYPDAPPCDSHDNRAYHGLWDGLRGCHHDHHHGDDPHATDDLFGTSLFSLMGGEISHPWQTFSDLGQENDLKHAGYFWHVRRDLPCVDRGCVTAFRVLVHQHPTGRDAAVRYHSGVIEANVLDVDTGRPGYIQVPGMWLDFGDLLVDGVPVIDVPGNGNRHKQHGSVQPGTTPQIIWSGASQEALEGRQGFVRISTSIHDVWDFTNPLAPSATDDVACWPNPRCPANGTLLRPHLITVSVPIPYRPVVDPDGDGIADWTGWTDRYGVIRTDCGSPSMDCVPVTMRGVHVTVTYRCEEACGQSYREHDIYFDGRSAGWSQPVP